MMTKLTATPSGADWRIYKGNGTPVPSWDIPEPPPWRTPRAAPALAAASAPPPPMSESAVKNGVAYKAGEDIVRMVNAALHLRRPLLITGGPGSGKSTLIDSVAYELGLGEPLRWAVTSRSTLREALYSYDAIGRVQYRDEIDSLGKKLDIGRFIELGPLGSAMLPALRPRALLIDEIDKADIDLPNDLLNVLEDGRFDLPELSRLGPQKITVRRKDGDEADIENGKVECYQFPLVIMTSNGERDFPAPFLRRCLQLRMPDPFKDRERLDSIVAAHLGVDKVSRSANLIAEFIARAERGEVLATDQLLNAVRMVMGGYAMNDDDKSRLLASLTMELGKKP